MRLGTIGGAWRRLAAACAATLLAAAAPIAQAEAPQPARSFTIAVLPDTQNYLDYTHQKAEGFAFDARELFYEQMRYVAANLVSAGGDIAFVTALGDVWQHQTLEMDPGHAARGFKRAPNPIMDRHFAPTPKVREVEMPAARQGYELLAGKTPFSVVPGNHDYDAMWTDARYPPNPAASGVERYGVLHPGGLSNFVSVFGAQSPFFRGQPWYVAHNDGGADSAQLFTAGGYTFLHIGLQFDPPDASLEWAASVIRRHPGLPTIVSTHDYMSVEGERVANRMIDGDVVDPVDNNPQEVWDKLISQHDQIFLVLCGHQHGQAQRVDDNRFGHKVWQLLSDYQDRRQTAIDAGVTDPRAYIGDGWLRLMTFRMDGEAPVVQVRTYSSHYRKTSRETAEYAQWYRPHEQPKMTDAEFHDADDFSITLTDFRERFGPGR